MTDTKSQVLTRKVEEILSILKNVIENEGGNPLIDYPVLIGSRAAKWHVPSYREPKDWDLVATPSQTTLFINKVMPNATFRQIKLIHYPSVGLKVVGSCIESHNTVAQRGRQYQSRDDMDANSIIFDIEIVSDKVDLRKMKSNDEKGIEFEKFNDDQPKMSGQMVLELCHDVENKAFFPLSSFPCIVAPLKILEALKASHIYWPSDFHKNIADLHSLRVLLGYNQVPMNQPLCSPQRDEAIELMLKTRIKETEIRQGIPGAHINLNKTNEEFLDREDELFIQRRVPHDELHERVKYGEQPIYESLKVDKSKAWIKKSLFQQVDYQTQLNCVKEEAMAIALERYLIPMISKNHETSYHSALVRVCTTLTKGWFRQFAIDNYPRLSNLDKDLLSIAHDIITNYPLQQKEKKLHMWTLDPETQAIFESINPYTKMISSFIEINDPGYGYSTERSGFKITSPVNDISITAIVTDMYSNIYDECCPEAHWSASVVILPSKDLGNLSEDLGVVSVKYDDYDYYDGDEGQFQYKFHDPLHLHPYGYYNEKYHELTSKHIFTVRIDARHSGSWEAGKDSWDDVCVCAQSADAVASKLEIPGFTGDLLFKYVLVYLQPALRNNGDTPLKHQVEYMKSKGAIPIKPLQHLWYDMWNLNLIHE